MTIKTIHLSAGRMRSTNGRSKLSNTVLTECGTKFDINDSNSFTTTNSKVTCKKCLAKMKKAGRPKGISEATHKRYLKALGMLLTNMPPKNLQGWPWFPSEADDIDLANHCKKYAKYRGMSGEQVVNLAKEIAQKVK